MPPEKAFRMSTIRPAPRPGSARPVLILGLVVLSGLCWGYLVWHALQLMPGQPWPAALTGSAPHDTSLQYRPHELLLVLRMWTIIMAAVMLPATARVVLLFASASRLHYRVRHPGLATLLFIAGNFVAWSGFAALATLAHWTLHDTGVLGDTMALSNSIASGLLMVAVGAYQWTPLKHSSLAHCRSPMSFVLAEWRPGALGPLRMGISHGFQCIGACAALMLLLFVAGVMNLPAIAALAVLLLTETLLPKGTLLACAAGLVLVAWGTAVLFP